MKTATMPKMVAFPIKALSTYLDMEILVCIGTTSQMKRQSKHSHLTDSMLVTSTTTIVEPIFRMAA